MQRKSQFTKILLGLIFVVIGSYPKLAFANKNSTKFSQQKTNNCQTNQQQPNFLVFGE